MTHICSLRDVRADKLEIVCDRCDRHGVYTVANLVANYGADTLMPEVLSQIINAGRCPRIEDYSDICRAAFSQETVRAFTRTKDMG